MDNKDPVNGSNWNEYRLLVINEIRRLDSSLGRIEDKVEKCKSELFILKAKAAIWGGIAGTVLSVIGSYIVQQLSGK